MPFSMKEKGSHNRASQIFREAIPKSNFLRILVWPKLVFVFLAVKGEEDMKYIYHSLDIGGNSYFFED